MNVSKSKLFASSNVSRQLVREMCRLTEVKQTQDLEKYLGMPILHNRVTKATYTELLDKVGSKLAGWQRKHLSFAGRVTLIKSVITAIPNYSMQTSLLPCSVVEGIEKIARGFLWGDSSNQRKIHHVGKGKVTQPKGKGGLGI